MEYVDRILTSVALLITAVTAWHVATRTTSAVKRTEVMVTMIDRAVNGQPPGEAPMVEQVHDLHDAQFPGEPDALLPLVRRLTEIVNGLASKDDS